ncbi:MAG: YqaJ viral recombinase family protein [Rhodospirillales bacterium]|nr:YqaJ viral recombinase family protein [Rhodospirillales bacterium]
MILAHIEQGSDEWHDARCGVVTASNFKAVLTGGRGKTRASYMRRLRDEIITGRPTPPSFQSAAMVRGCDLEPQARRAYEEHAGESVREVGIVYLNDQRRVAASPDGLVNGNGGLEIKCPLPHNHEKYFREGRVPAQYVPQVQGNLWVTGREWWDFVSYAPEFPPEYRLMTRRVYRDEAFISLLKAEVERFIEELDKAVQNT